jgi:sugar/nucleoside kinase (ribokinase family)
MLDVVIYGKIIIDDINRGDGSVARGLLGGGGPQAAFGARLWNDSVGLLSRAGADLAGEHRSALAARGVNLTGVAYYEDAATLRARPILDGWHLPQPPATPDRETQDRETQDREAQDREAQDREAQDREAQDREAQDREAQDREAQEAAGPESWAHLLSRPLDLPATHRRPRVIHLITEYADEPMVATALAMRARGALLSLEPLIDVNGWTNREQIVALLPQVDMVTPDWPSASGIAGTDDPRRVLAHWSRLGPGLVAVRHDEHGSYVWSRHDDRSWHIPAVAVRVTDPTGAGNSYGGGLCAGWLRSGNAVQAGAFAAVSASFMLEHVGMPSTPEQYRAVAQRRLQAVEPTVRPL